MVRRPIVLEDNGDAMALLVDSPICTNRAEDTAGVRWHFVGQKSADGTIFVHIFSRKGRLQMV